MPQNLHYKDVRTDGGSTITVKQQPDESYTQAILRGVAELKGVTVTALDPLYNSVEVDAMEQLIDHSQEHKSNISISFTFEGCIISITEKDNNQITQDSIQRG
ncbi:HalOD1 output domain-containing protein [Natrarchaeobius chitinivorans]|uniref:HalOD1 output domain-containing protein n=1 Tax=Natrarchaeobius chitinivorans TaxID=1679083 RepID=UPI000F51E855|nr:HalOD1 output domain-containing protein [Natrarchaeobius chitinivorans]